MGSEGFDGGELLVGLERHVADWRFRPGEQARMVLRCQELMRVLGACTGERVQDRWNDFETRIWPGWVAGHGRAGGELWRWGTWAMVLSRTVRPSWAFMFTGRVGQWLDRLPIDDPLVREAARLRAAVDGLDWVGPMARDNGVNLGVRLLLVTGHDRLERITEADLTGAPVPAKGMDTLDAGLCRLGVLGRSPQRGTSRRQRVGRLSPAEMVERSDIPERFRAVTVLYLETYANRISDVYGTLHAKQIALGHWWRFLDGHHPEVASPAEITPAHAYGFIDHALERARLVRRAGEVGHTTTAHAWLVYVRTFFADLCTWAAEPGSPFAGQAPAMIPLTRHALRDIGFEQARRRTSARTAATVIELEREMPNIRAYAWASWHDADTALAAAPEDRRLLTREVEAFWDWAVLELLVQSGVRIEEACELTALDVLKRRLADGRAYYLLHVKPSKFDRARVIPIGDGLGRVLAEIVRYVKRFYGTPRVPACDHWDGHEKRPRPRAPYLLQGVKHPSALAVTTIRGRLAILSARAGAQRADGSPLLLRPHDCRRVFASEHLNNHTPPHVIQALLGHATIDTVMVYAKLYPAELVDGYRRALRGIYSAAHGPDALRNPTAEEWATFTASCSMRDMGTHLCVLPTGEHCAKGLVCLGCVHAQPKGSAAPTFHRTLASHRRALAGARLHGEPAGQIAARKWRWHASRAPSGAPKSSATTSLKPSRPPLARPAGRAAPTATTQPRRDEPGGQDLRRCPQPRPRLDAPLPGPLLRKLL